MNTPTITNFLTQLMNGRFLEVSKLNHDLYFKWTKILRQLSEDLHVHFFYKGAEIITKRFSQINKVPLIKVLQR